MIMMSHIETHEQLCIAQAAICCGCHNQAARLPPTSAAIKVPFSPFSSTNTLKMTRLLFLGREGFLKQNKEGLLRPK
jgi:hypothetical protein